MELVSGLGLIQSIFWNQGWELGFVSARMGSLNFILGLQGIILAETEELVGCNDSLGLKLDVIQELSQSVRIILNLIFLLFRKNFGLCPVVVLLQ